MSILNKYNRKPLFNYDADQKRDFISLKELVQNNGFDAVYPVEAIFINTKSHFGNAPVLIIPHYSVNCPQHMLEICQEMMNDEELIEAVNQRKVGFKVYEYRNKYGVGYGVEWTELTI